MSKCKFWCAYCYEEARQEGRTIIDQLTWTLKDITVCTVHQTELTNMCAGCDGRFGWLERYTIPGYCSLCKAWLGKSQPPQGYRGDRGSPSCSLSFSLSIATLFKADKDFAPSSAAQLLEKNRVLLAKGPAGTFAQMLGVGMDAVTRWKRGTVPSLGRILKLCDVLGISFTEYMDGRNVPSDLLVPLPLRRNIPKPRASQVKYEKGELPALVQEALCEYPPPSISDVARRISNSSTLNARVTNLFHRVPDLCRQLSDRRLKYTKRLNQERRRSLRAYATGKQQPPLSVDEVANLLEVGRGTVKRLCPKSYDRIQQRYNNYKRTQREERETDILKEIRTVVYHLHQQGTFPSLPKVAALLPASSWLAAEPRRQLLRQIQTELGYRVVK